MHNAVTSFFTKNSTAIQFGITLVSLFVTLIVFYVTSRIAPLATHIDQVDARMTQDEQYIPPFISLQQRVADLKDNVDRIDSTTQNTYKLLLEEKKSSQR